MVDEVQLREVDCSIIVVGYVDTKEVGYVFLFCGVEAGCADVLGCIVYLGLIWPCDDAVLV